MRIDTRSSEEEAGINLTPLIDVVFLLLIFFMVTATFQNDERDLTITVPEAENGNPIKDLPQTIVVGIKKDGSFSVGGKILDREQLRTVLVKAKRKNKKKQRVIVRTHKDAASQYPVTVIDVCSGLGIETSISTAAKKGD
ncbi:MAG: biopolymer transporter ExbD [Planctomycetes bacterium]|nr:biopolymer transporter ExbD [Planctomycetota bacterium]